MGKVSESIFSGKTMVIAMADVQHVEKSFEDRDMLSGAKKGDLSGCQVITKHTRWDMEADTWANAIWLPKEQTERFLSAWCHYRAELEGNIKGPEDE